MTLFRRGEPVEKRFGWNADDALAALTSQRLSLAGGMAMHVTDDRAMSHSAVHQCVNLIADLVSGFPADVYTTDSEGFPALVTAPRQIIETPSAEIDAINWRRLVVIAWLLRGNAYGRVTEMQGAYPLSIELIHPDRVKVEKPRPDARSEFFLDDKPIERWPLGDLWHAPGKILTPGSPLGASVIDFARQDIGLGLSARRFGSQTFTSGGIPTAVLMNEKPVNEDGAKRVKKRFLDAQNGTREPAVFGDGWKYQQIQIAPNESQFLETIQANKADVAGFFNIPPELIGAKGGDSMTYSNVESRGIDLLRFCINGWVVRMDHSLSGLLLPGEKVRLDVDDLLRSDLATRTQAEAEAIRAGWKSRNEVRRQEHYKPIPGGDALNWPPDAKKYEDTQAGMESSTSGKVASAGALIRAGFDPEAALAAVGLPPIKHTGLVPVTVAEPDPPAPSTP